jgi:hypothetical protein
MRPLVPSQVVLRLLTLAITIVVGFQVGPQLSVHHTSVPIVGCSDQKVAEDAFKVGERREPRVFAAQFLDRLPPAHPSRHNAAVAAPNEVLALGALLSDDRSYGVRLPIVKHVPRMERGDPPRA